MKEHKMAMELQALSLEGREEFAAKVFELNKKHALAVLTLTTQEEKAAYIDGIPQEVLDFFFFLTPTVLAR